MSEYSNVKKSLRQFAGISLDDNRVIPSNWVIIREEVVAGSPHSFLVRLAVFPETFSGFAKGKGQQSSSGYLGTGSRNLGIEIEVEDLGTGKRGSDRTFEDISFAMPHGIGVLFPRPWGTRKTQRRAACPLGPACGDARFCVLICLSRAG